MGRYAFQLRIRAGKESDYDKHHECVWPELLHDLTAAGVREYSIFRRGQVLFLYLHVDDFDLYQKRMESSTANRKWQTLMADLFEPVTDLEPGEQVAMMREVFFMPGAPESEGSA